MESILEIKTSFNEYGRERITLKCTHNKDIIIGEKNQSYINERKEYFITIRKNLNELTGEYYKGYPIKKCELQSCNLNYDDLLYFRDSIDKILKIK